MAVARPFSIPPEEHGNCGGWSDDQARSSSHQGVRKLSVAVQIGCYDQGSQGREIKEISPVGINATEAAISAESGDELWWTRAFFSCGLEPVGPGCPCQT